TPDTRGDWWGWAAVLLFAATGRPPFGTGPLAAVLARVETGRADVDGLPPRVGQVLRRALHPEPELRLSPQSVIKALDDHLFGREVTQVVALADDDDRGPTRPGTQQLPPSYAPPIQHGWGEPVAHVAAVPHHPEPVHSQPAHPEPVHLPQPVHPQPVGHQVE